MCNLPGSVVMGVKMRDVVYATNAHTQRSLIGLLKVSGKPITLTQTRILNTSIHTDIGVLILNKRCNVIRSEDQIRTGCGGGPQMFEFAAFMGARPLFMGAQLPLAPT